MIKRTLCLILALLLTVVLCSCKQKNQAKLPHGSDYSHSGISDEEIESILSQMTLEEKIWQMLITEQTNGTPLNSPAPGGIILFEENFVNSSITKEYIAELKAQSRIPLIVSVDQEGGKVQRLKGLYSPKATNIPYMYDLGKTGNPYLAFETGQVMGKEMSALGINTAFAPVLDIYSNKNNTVIGKRSFGEDTETVSVMGISLAKGIRSTGVVPCFKHFPGHGDTETDSHISLPVINRTREQLYKRELIPFKSAIDSGAEIIMVGHIALPKVTGNNTPATLSREIITDLLITEMGFKGLVVTDALNMGALTKNYSDSEIYKMTVDAGADLLLMPRNPQLAVKVIGESFTTERIEQSVRKILRFKYKYLSEQKEYPLSCIGSAEHKQIIDKIK